MDEKTYIQLPPMTPEEITDIISMCRLGVSLIRISGLTVREASILQLYQYDPARFERVTDTFNNLADVTLKLVKQSVGEEEFEQLTQRGEEFIEEYRKWTDAQMDDELDMPPGEYLH